MIRTALGLVLVLATTLSGCASSAVNLRPDAVPEGYGAFFGKLEVFRKGENITDSCYAEFTDSEDSRKRYTSLNDSGWVYSSAETGPTYLSKVLCTIRSGLFTTNAIYETRDLRFDIATHRELVYFGHVRVELNVEDPGFSPLHLLGGAGAGAAAAAGKDAGGKVTVQNRSDLARADYGQRFGSTASALRFVGKPLQTRVPASQPARGQ